MSVGKVWLVGAGPGDAGLLTCRGREVLEQADVVVYDRLAGDSVLSLMPAGVERINVGKSGGCHPVPQEEIEKILVAKALEGKKTVRLKGGDPFLFGRGGEEIEALAARGIPYEVIPGISSAIAVPECAGIPVTHRGLADSVHIITAHTREGGLAAQDYAALAHLGGTLVFLMGVSALPEICTRLQKEGWAPDTPAAAVECGTTARQRTLAGTLESLPRRAAEFKLRPPAVIVAGPTVSFAEKFDWHDSLPLWGVKVIVTRPKNRQGRLSRMLRSLGAEVVEFPIIETVPLDTPLPPLDAPWIGFTSASGVEYFFAALERENLDIRCIGSAKIAAVGKGTASALRARGLHVDLIPQISDGAHLAEELASAAGSKKILLFRAENGSPELTSRLRELGADFSEIPLYRTTALPAPFIPRNPDAAVFASASAVRAFRRACPDLAVPFACCIGAQTAAEARRLGYGNIGTAKKAVLEELVETLKEHFRHNQCQALKTHQPE
ncbi:MAG: uroporphyrinogen-III C-methyltransferase [Pyramidobacter sp.]